MNRIRSLRTEKNISREKLAEYLNVSGRTVGHYETGKREPDFETLKKLADYFNVSTDYLLGISNTKNIIPASSPNAAVVLVYGTIPAGVPMECIEDILDTEEIPVDLLKGGKEYFGLRIKGDSMFPEYLDGDTLILQKVDDCESGDDCVVMVNGNDGTFKRIFKNENGIILQPLNPAYQPVVYTNDQITNTPVKVLGVCVEIRRRKRK